MVCNIWSWACKHGPNRGWSARRILLTYLSWCVNQGWIYVLLVFFCYTRCNSTTWIFSFAGFSSISYLDILLRSLLHPWGSFKWFNAPNFFWGGSRMVWWTCNYFCAIWLAWCCVCESTVSTIVSGLLCYFNRAILAVVLLDSCLLFSCVKGDQKLSEGGICAWERCLGKSSPWILV